MIEERTVRLIAEPVRSNAAESAVASAVETAVGAAASLDTASVRVAVQAHSFRGPMPLPEQLAQYDKIVPGAARLIVDEFQTNSRHAREIEHLSVRGSIRKDRRAQFIAAMLVLIGFGLVYALADGNHDGVAVAVAVTLLVSVLTAFLSGKVMRTKVNGELGDALDA
jgi:uncharacterized membrane protein